jgi:hypothetical protein
MRSFRARGGDLGGELGFGSANQSRLCGVARDGKLVGLGVIDLTSARFTWTTRPKRSSHWREVPRMRGPTASTTELQIDFDCGVKARRLSSRLRALRAAVAPVAGPTVLQAG